MKKIILLLALIPAVLSAQTQKALNIYEQTDKRAAQIPETATGSAELGSYIRDNFSTETDKARAAYVWIAQHIDYDLENMYAINFYEKDEERIQKVLALRKGVCAHYAALYHDICRHAGLRSFVVEGFTQQGATRDDIPHAWCAVQLDDAWYMVDPTWGAGYVSNNKYTRKLNNEYFKVSPAVFVKSHMPFDYLWQFLGKPITVQEFYERKTSAAGEDFSYTDSIAAHMQLDSIKQTEAIVRRIEKNGLKNSMIFDRYQHLRLDLERMKQNRTVNLYNSAVIDMNDAVADFNDYINYYNKQFTPMKSDNELQEMLDKVDRKISAAKAKLTQLGEPGDDLQAMVRQMNRSMDDIGTQLAEQQAWLKKYLAKGKMGRKTSFQKYTWMGIPLN